MEKCQLDPDNWISFSVEMKTHAAPCNTNNYISACQRLPRKCNYVIYDSCISLNKNGLKYSSS